MDTILLFLVLFLGITGVFLLFVFGIILAIWAAIKLFCDGGCSVGCDKLLADYLEKLYQKYLVQ